MIVLSNFRGEFPKLSRFAAVPPNSAACARNCDVRTGAIRPQRQLLNVRNVASTRTGIIAASDIRIVEYDRPCNQQITANQIAVADGQSDVQYLRRVETGSAMYKLGVPRPTAAITGIKASAGVATDMISLVFAYSYVNRDGAEGELGGTFAAPAAATDATWQLSVPEIDADLLEGYDTTDMKRRIYVNRSGTMHFFAELDAGDVPDPYTDTSTLGESKLLRGSDDALPPTGASHIALMPGNFLAASVGNKVMFSEPNMHHIWPQEYTLDMGEKVMGLANNVDTMYVMLEETPPAIITANDPAAPQIYYSSIPWPCVSGQSVVNTGYGVVYASRSGLVALQGVQGQLLTRNQFDEETFAPYSPNRIRAYTVEGVYYGYGNGKPFKIDMQSVSGEPELLSLQDDPSDAKAFGGNVYSINQGLIRQAAFAGLPAAYEYRTNPIRMPKPENWLAFQVKGDFADVQSRNLAVGGLGSLDLASAEVGDAKVTQSTEMTTGILRVQFLGKDDEMLADMLVDDNSPYPVDLSLIDEVTICLTGDVQVHQLTIAHSIRELERIPT